MPSATILDRREFTANLRTALATATGRPIGNHVAPDPPAGANSPSVPYGILYAVGGGGFGGPEFASPTADAAVVYQVTSIGIRPDQVEWLADRVRKTILGRDVNGAFVTAITAPTGYVLGDRWPDAGAGPIDPGDNSLYSLAERYVFWLTPA
ncbi:MAG: hypothetical protein ACR2M4_06395 [Actinomycetota bacterium]